MIEFRLYRAAFVPAVLAAVFVMFSFVDRPAPLPQGLAADVLFEEGPAGAVAERLARSQPDRRPGTPGNRASARQVAETLRARGFETSVDHFEEGGHELINVVGRRAGTSRSQIVLMAARDGATVPDARGSAADTAALLEISRVLSGRAARKTIVLASVDGSALGEAGARRFIENAPDRDRIEAVLVMSNFGAPDSGEPVLIGWSNDVSREPVALARTAAGSLSREVGPTAGSGGLLSQFGRLALPVAIGAQGALLERGVDAIRFSGSGELPDRQPGGPVDEERLGGLGRAALRTVSAIDRGPPLEEGPRSYVGVSRKILPGWTVSLLVLSLIFPALVAAVDAFARARRRREPITGGLLWVVAAVLAPTAGLVVAELLTVLGQAPDAPPAPLVPGYEPLDARAAAALGVTTAVIALVAVFGRPRLVRLGEARSRAARQRRPSGQRTTPPEAGQATALALVLALTSFAVWVVNPFAALLLVPALHLWTVGSLSDVAERGRVGAALVVGGLLLPAIALGSLLGRLSLDPLEGAWYLYLLVTGHHVGLLAALIGCTLLGALGCFIGLAVTKARRGPAQQGEVTPIRGPASYAGPGSLGGTESALKK